MADPNIPRSFGERSESSEEWLLFQLRYPELATNIEGILFVPQVAQLIGGPTSNKFILPETSSLDEPPRIRQPEETLSDFFPAIESSQLSGFTTWWHAMDRRAEEQYDLALMDVRSSLEQRITPTDFLFVPDTIPPRLLGYLTRLTRLAQDTRTTVIVRTVDVEASRVFSDDFRFITPPTASSVDAYWASIPAPERLIKPIVHDEESYAFVELFRGNIASLESWIQINLNTPPSTQEKHLWRVSAIKGMLSLEDPEATSRVNSMLVRLLHAPPIISSRYAYSVFGPLITGLPAYVDGLHRRNDSQAGQEIEAIKQALAILLDNVVAGTRMDLVQKTILYDLRNISGNILLDNADPSLQPLLERHIRQLFIKQGSIITDPAFETQYLKYRSLYGDLDDINQHITITPK